MSREDEWRAGRIGFRADWDTTPGGDAFTLQGDAYSSDSGKLRSVPQLTAPFVTTIEENISAEGGNLLGRWTRDLNDGALLTIQAYVDSAARRQFALKDRRTSFDFDVQYDFPSLESHELIAGVRYRYSHSRLTPSQTITFDQGTRNDELFSGFIQDKITLDPESLFLTLGSKFEHNDHSGFEMQPSARLQWLIDEHQTAWAAISRAVRVPSWLEQDLTIRAGVIPPGTIPTILVPIQVELQPSPGFDSEELIAYEFGYRTQCAPNLSFDLAAFYNDYDKLSTLTLLPPVPAFPPPHLILPIATTNLTTGQAYGFELVATWRAAETLDISAAYSFLEIELHGPPSNRAINAEVGERQSPQQQFNMRVRWDANDRLAVDSTLFFVDELPAFGIDSYVRLDARLGWRATDEVQIELVGQDLFDQTGIDQSGAEIGRSIFGRLTWRS